MNEPQASSDPCRPAEVARLLLASGELRPRQRARDQQADTIGLELKRRMLELLMMHDPEPEDLERALCQVVEEMGPPTGPARAIASSFLTDYRAGQTATAWFGHLLHEAIEESKTEKRRGP